MFAEGQLVPLGTIVLAILLCTTSTRIRSAAADGFDPDTYRLYSPELRGVSNEEALLHYVFYGRTRGAIGRPVSIRITYTASGRSGGLCNQLFSHIGAIMIAHQLNATLVIAPALSRGSFLDGGEGTLPGSAIRKGGFQVEAPETILDWNRIAGYWKGQPDTTMAIVKKEAAKDDSGCIMMDLTNYDDPYLLPISKFFTVPLPDAVSLIAGNISWSAQPLLKMQPERNVCVHLYLGYPLHIIHHTRDIPFLMEVLRGFYFPAEVVKAADSIIDSLRSHSLVPFMGVHLRIEDDFKGFAKLAPKNLREDPIMAYVEVMRQAGFTRKTVCYIASGVFSYYTAKEVQDLEMKLTREGVCRVISHKEMVLSNSQIKGFHSEQQGLIDLLVLAQAELFVGDARSSLTAFLRVYRYLHGRPWSTFSSVSPMSTAWGHIDLK